LLVQLKSLNHLKTNICVNAATGRMGQQITHQINVSDEVELSSAFCRFAHPYHHKTVPGSTNIQYSNDISNGLSISQVVIDFSLPTVSLALLETAVESNTAVLIGTTGFSEAQLKQIKTTSQKIPILLAPNTSIGVNVTLSLIAKAAAMLGEQANIEIIEAHHKHKIDAPSGTAIKMAEVICESTQTSLADRAVYKRHDSKTERTENEIGFSVIRAGEIIGEHKVMFVLNNEIISIEHKAQSRQCFAEGAVKAAVWLARQDNGLYSMQDFLAE
jgi:4-hydroxy-tetrahydrodipicolinate reductase